MNCNITITNRENIMTYAGSLSELIPVLKNILSEIETIKTKKNKTMPSSIKESVIYAKSLGYKNVISADFSSAHRVLQKMPKLITSFSCIDEFEGWYRKIETELKKEKKIKTISLERYFEEAIKCII